MRNFILNVSATAHLFDGFFIHLEFNKQRSGQTPLNSQNITLLYLNAPYMRVGRVVTRSNK